MDPSVPSVLNDVHSQLNPTRVQGVERPGCVEDVARLVKEAAKRGASISVGGRRHAMGGQQFGEGTLHIDTGGLIAARAFDDCHGLLTIGAGAVWPEVIAASHRAQERIRPGQPARWGIRQKPTGADDISIGGCISANIHGRGLLMRPFGDDIENLTRVDARGETAP